MAATKEWLSEKIGLSSKKESDKEQQPMMESHERSKASKNVQEGAQEYHGKDKQSVADIKNRGSTAIHSNMTKMTSDTMGQIHVDIVKGSSGGVPSLEAVEDCNVLDLLGCVTGRDAFVLSKLVGPKGKVVGIHLKKEQIDMANKYVDYHTKQFEYESPNLEFKQGSLEDLKAVGIPDDYFDLIVSNFVLNLSERKHEALAEAYRVLKNGGELYISDIYSNKQEIPEEARKENQEVSDYISGALYWKDLNKIASELGFSQPILVGSKCLPLRDEEIEKRAGIQLISATYRIFKLDQKAVQEAGKGAKVIYKGSIVYHEKCLKFAEGIIFPAGKPIHVDASLAAILKTSRFGKHFDYESSQENVELRDLVKLQETDPFSCAEPSSEE
jgi:arsenite methyltransferase